MAARSFRTWTPTAIAPLAFGLVVGGLPGAFVAQSEPAIGQFELKGLEAEPGEVEFQSQNAWSFGQPRRQYSQEEPGAYVYDDNSVTRQRHALEIEMSLTHFLRMRVGIEYEKERFDEPPSPGLANAFDDLQLTEVALEGVVILRKIPEAGGFGFGVLTEFEHPIATGELNSVLFGPILGAKAGKWSALLNVMFVKHFGSGEVTDEGLERDQKWDIAYAAQIKYDFNTSWALALEAYGTFDRIGNSGTPGEGALAFGDHDQHRAGPVAYYEWRVGGGRQARAISHSSGSSVASLDMQDEGQDGEDDEGVLMRLGTGVLFGLNNNTPDTTLKVSLEAEF
ncbi:MAG: hypothetical protein KDJ45_14705 [Hyphomicrobiaceae bacterium]|mgnify:CR=1 FL=1|nr:hypothetical protein [Hyphomicrobiaceae bacterium]MCC0011339.1 hypothetical protein [Hyphomicrobiaceae bacterium]